MKRRVWDHEQVATRIAAARRWRNVGQVVAAAETNGAGRYMLTGARPGGDLDGWRAWSSDRHLPDGWAADPGGHYLHHSTPILHYVHRDGRRLAVLRAATWLGDGDYSPDVARRSLRAALGAVRASSGHDGLPLLTTPATQGRDLWARSIPWDADVPTLDARTQQVIRDTAGQGRWELFAESWPPPTGEPSAGLSGWDMRLAYGACLRGLADPSTTRHVDQPERWEWHQWKRGGSMRYRRGRFQVSWIVPDGWRGHGVLPVQVDGHDGCPNCNSVSDGSWCWPSLPGSQHFGWVDGAELAIAADHGWTWTVRRAITWDHGRPLDRWARWMIDAYRAVAGHHDPDVVRWARAAIRMVLIQAVGAWWGSPHRHTGVVDNSADVPDGAAVTLRGGRIHWTTVTDPAWSAASHPEWSAAVWSRCRARMLDHDGRGLLHVPAGDLVAVRQDAMYLAGRGPSGWDDDGRVGTLRPDGRWPDARWPDSIDGLLKATGGR